MGGARRTGRGKGCQGRCLGAVQGTTGLQLTLGATKTRNPPLGGGGGVAAGPVGSLGGASPESSPHPWKPGKTNPTQTIGSTSWRREVLG